MGSKAMAEMAFEVREGGSFLFDRAGGTRIFTPETLTDDQKQMRDTARKFADTEVLPRIADIEAKTPGLMRELLEKAGELGLLMLDIPEKYGGLEQDKTTTMLITESLTRCASFAVSMGAHVGIGSLPLVYFGTVAQKERYLPKLATGEWIAAYALTETESGSDALAAKTRADLSDDGTHYLLNGTKQWITNAGFADLFVVFAQVDGDKFTAFLVERTFTGFQVGPEEHKHGIKGSSTCPLVLQNVPVPVENVLGDIGKGHRIAFNILNVGRARLGIGSVGAGKYALGLATRYATDRRQFGKALVEFGLIRGKLGEMAGRTFAGESMGYRTAGLIDKKYQALEVASPGPDDDDFQRATEEFTIESSILKVYGSEILDYVADEALQIHGGYGYMTEYDIERVSRDARINRIFEGTNEINRMLLAGTVLKRGMKQRIPLMKVFGEVAAALSAGTV
ncbi:MAG: alkylation response protein AidB-like acyl-CoA dehydrogenase, partial [Myxococcota bacterium]